MKKLVAAASLALALLPLGHSVAHAAPGVDAASASVSLSRTAYLLTGSQDLADDLVSGDEWQAVAGEIPVQDLQVGPADGRGLHADEDLVGGGLGIRAITDHKSVDGGHGRGVHASQCAAEVGSWCRSAFW